MLGVVDTITVVVGALQIVVPEGLDVGAPVGVQSNDNDVEKGSVPYQSL